MKKLLTLFSIRIRRGSCNVYQKLTRGFSDSDLWNLDIEIAHLIYPRLKRFKEIKLGYPAELTEEEWDIILDKMIAGFDSICNKEDFFREVPEETEALELFSKYFFSLWI